MEQVMQKVTLSLIIGVLVLARVSSLSVDNHRHHCQNQQHSQHERTKSFCDRRGSIQIIASAATIVAAPIAFPNLAALAIGEGEQRMLLKQKPTAPLGALLPAAQQRLLLEECLMLSSKLVKNEQDETSLGKLKSILVNVEGSSGDNKKIPNNKDLAVMKQYQPNKSLSGSITRAAMNVYMANLSYGEQRQDQQQQYTVTDPEWKKAYIRANEGLPNTAQVIEADLNLRDLYRNQVQLKLDDASAELYIANRDAEELHTLLQEAADTFDQWLGRIEDKDVGEAMQAALEGKSLRVYDSYYAGFVPPRR